MRKVLTLVLGLLIGCGNFAFAYASTSMDCESMRQSSVSKPGLSAQPHSCCKPDACQCSIKTSPNELFASLSPISRPTFEVNSIRFSDDSATIFKAAALSIFLFQKSPSKEAHLYDLYSIYRI